MVVGMENQRRLDRPVTVCSFYVSRPKDFPNAAPYLECLKILDKSCERFGFEHVVLTDITTSEAVTAAGFRPFMADLPRSLMKSTTEIQARWLESPHSEGVDSVFVGADCIIRRDFREAVPDCDVSFVYMKGHKKWRINNGFMCVRAESREKVAPLFRAIANDTGEAMCEDMIAIERALVPMPSDYGVHRRNIPGRGAGGAVRRLDVGFLPVDIWNRGYEMDVEDPALDAYVLHFMGGWDAVTGKSDGKRRFFEWARRHGFA